MACSYYSFQNFKFCFFVIMASYKIIAFSIHFNNFSVLIPQFYQVIFGIYLRIDKTYTIYLKLLTNFPKSQIAATQKKIISFKLLNKTCFFFKLLRKLATKHDTLFVTSTQYKTQNSPFVCHNRINLFVHLKPIMSERKRVKRSTRADSIYSEPEGLIHDGPKDIVRIPSQNI